MATVACSKVREDGTLAVRVFSPTASFRVDIEAGKVVAGCKVSPSYTAVTWLIGRLDHGWKICPPPFSIRGKVPTDRTLRRWSFDGIARATDGCKIEPDGTCHHGAPSWLKVLGAI